VSIPISPGSWNNPYAAYQINTSANGNLGFLASNNNSWSSFNIPSVQSNKIWHNIIVTYNSGNSNIYQNGKLVVSTSSLYSPIYYGGGDVLCIGSDSATYDTGAKNVKMSDVRIYNRIITGAEVWETYRNPRGIIKRARDDDATILAKYAKQAYLID
jgi:hypothetical protein